MMPGPTLIKKCYKCDGFFKQGTLASGNTFDAKWWPDGKMDAPMLPETPALINCPSCNEYLWLSKTKEVDVFRPFDDYDNTHLKYLKVSFFNRPNIDSFMLVLKEKNLTKNKEAYVRVKLMHFFNDVNRDMEEPISEPSNIQLENYDRLLILASKDNANDTILRAEIYRELGEFDKSLNLLDKVKSEDFIKSANHLKRLCFEKDSRVMQIYDKD